MHFKSAAEVKEPPRLACAEWMLFMQHSTILYAISGSIKGVEPYSGSERCSAKIVNRAPTNRQRCPDASMER